MCCEPYCLHIDKFFLDKYLTITLVYIEPATGRSAQNRLQLHIDYGTRVYGTAEKDQTDDNAIQLRVQRALLVFLGDCQRLFQIQDKNIASERDEL